VTEAVRRCLGLASRAGVNLVSQVATGLPALLADRGRLVQVLQNLVQNAIQHSRRGGTVTVDAEMEEAEGGPWVVLKVGDSGRGIAAADLPHVFEPFFSKRPGGTGLGLAIAQRIVVEHGGTISASNRPEGGALMSVRLPCAGFAEPSVPHAPRP